MITLDGKRLNEFGMQVLENHSNPLLPTNRNNSLSLPGMHGTHDFDSYMDAKYFSVPIGIMPQSSFESLRRNAEKFTYLLLDQYGKPKEVELRFDYLPERFYKVKYYGQLSLERLITMGRFDLSLKAFDPWIYAPATYYDPEFIASYDGEAEYDAGLEYKNQTHTPFTNITQFAGVYNYSHYATPFSFVIEGYVENPKITNQTTGKSAQWNITVEADEKLYVDAKLKTTWKVKAVNDDYFWTAPTFLMKDAQAWDKINKYNDMSGHFIDLVAGGNSLLFEGENPNADIYFNWYHRFM